jgi:FtsX-like permease family
MGAIAGARRTQSSYPTFLAGTNPSDLNVAVYNPATNGGPGANLTAKIAHLAGVKRVRVVLGPTVVPLARNGAPELNVLSDLEPGGSIDGDFSEQDRLTVVAGRNAHPNRADEMVMDQRAAQVLGVRVGQVVPIGFYTDAQTNAPGFGTPTVTPRLRFDVKVVGIVVPNNEVVEDDIDRVYGLAELTPAFLKAARAASPAAAAPVLYSLQLDDGSSGVSAVEKEVVGLVPKGFSYEFHVTSRVVTEVELAIKPESVALGGFGALAGAVALVLGAQAISRQLSASDEDRRVLRAIGAGPAVTAADGLIGTVFAVIVGSLVALSVAVGLSGLFPVGPVRSVYPDKGFTFDATVLGIGVAVLIVGLGAVAVVRVVRGAPARSSRFRAPARPSSITRGAEAAGAPVAGVVGIRFALEPGRGRTAVPVRSVLLGTIMAVVVLVATLTFASGLNTLASSPALYGWNWTYALNPSNDVPPAALTLLNHDSDVAAWTGVDYNNFEIDGESVPVLFGRPGAAVAPPILSGHGLDANNQIVIGSSTLAVLHKHVGDTVELSYETPADAPIYLPPTPLKIVGTATFPAVGYASLVADHTSMGTGALFSKGVFSSAFLRAVGTKDPNLNGPELVFVRLRSGLSAAAGRANLQRIADAANKIFAGDPGAVDNSVAVIGVQRPAQIVNYRSIGATPVILAGGLALGAIVALALTLVASVRRRRRDLALLKALGFSPRQLAAVVAWQSTVTAVVGVIVGVPLGIVIGRQLWTVFARNINAVPDPTVPVLSVVLVALGALVFANVVAAIPGRIAAQTPTALVLRAE